jgi:diguanylate cyclase (GGDEF)-like protein
MTLVPGVLALSALSLAQPASEAAVAPLRLSVSPQAIGAMAASIITGLLLLLYFYRRRQYILYWVAGWVTTAASMLIPSQQYSSVKIGAMAYGISQFLGIVSALIFVVSADAYRTRTVLRREYLMVLLPIFLWFSLAPLALETKSVLTPGHLLMAGAFTAAGVAHLVLFWQARLLGAAMVGTMLIAIAALNGWLALKATDPTAAGVGRLVLVGVALYLVTALGMQLMTFEDMTYELRKTNRRLESAQAELRQMVTTDALTGCRNRRFFDEVISREIQRHRRYNLPLSILFIDVNRFKAINDTLGHEAGDRVLQKVAAFLVRHVREADYVFRWGGDEFLILISCTEQEAARKGSELQAAFAHSSDAAALPRGVGLSVGIAEVPEKAHDIMQLVKVADERMYQNKKTSR